MGAHGNCDVLLAQCGEETGLRLVSCLQTKGFCIIDAGVPGDMLTKAYEDVAELRNAGRLEPPPLMVANGLLGPSGSARIAELKAPKRVNDAEHGCEGLEYFDVEMEIITSPASPFLGELGLEIRTRSRAVLHEVGEAPVKDPILTQAASGKWLSIFVKHGLMVIWYLGPATGTLELQPLDSDTNPHNVSLEPGSLVVLRADAMYRRVSSPGEAYCMSCFLQKNEQQGRVARKQEELVPWAHAINEWMHEQIQAICESGASKQLDLDPIWQRMLVHNSFSGQPTVVKSASMRQTAASELSSWFSALESGFDAGMKVPLTRWDVEEFYDKSPDSGSNGKICCQHGAFIEGAELFDNNFFRLSKSEASGMDPGHRLILETGYEALYKAGYRGKDLMNSRGGVYVANPSPLEWQISPKGGGGGVCGGGGSIACGRFSFIHGLKGPCISCDVEGASSLAVIDYAQRNISRSGVWQPIPFALCTGYHLQLIPYFSVQYTSSGLLSHEGRCFSMDQSADGFVRGEACVSSVMKPYLTVVDGKPQEIDEADKLGLLFSVDINQSGRRAGMLAHDGTAQQEACYHATRMAGISPLDVEAVECHADGNLMGDAVEMSATNRAFRPQGISGLEEYSPLGLMSLKANMGNQIECAGLTTMIKVMLTCRWGKTVPCIHICAINPQVDLEMCERRARVVTESCEFALTSTYHSMGNRSLQGTNCHAVFRGEVEGRLLEQPAPQSRPKIFFWPGGGGVLNVPQSGYFIAGSWSRWNPTRMDSDTDGVYTHVVTIGEDGQEHFQVWVDGDKLRALHPGVRNGGLVAQVFGPEMALRGLSWMLGDGDEASIGRRYLIRLKVAGKWFTVEWEQLSPGEGVLSSQDREGSQFHVVGIWGGGRPLEMTPDPSSHDVLSLEVQVTATEEPFVIIRDLDWNRVLRPTGVLCTKSHDNPPTSEQDEHGENWSISGNPGDIFRIRLSRLREKGKLVMNKVTWEFVRHEPLDQDLRRLSTQEKYMVAGTWDGWNSQFNMRWTGSFYQFFVRMGRAKQESFQIASPGGVLFPSIEHASPYDDHTVLGPSSSGSHVWTIGNNLLDEVSPGAIVEIRLVIDKRNVAKVSWTVTSADVDWEEAHGGGFLAWRL